VIGGTTIEGKPCSAGSHNPCEDVEFLEKELDMWYLGILNKVWRTFSRTIASSKEPGNFAKAVAKQFSGLKIDEEIVERALAKTKLSIEKADRWNNNELFNFARTLRILSKPMIIAANKCDIPEAKENIRRLNEKFPDYLIVACSADSELALRSAAKAGIIDYIPGERDFIIKKEINSKQK